MSICVCVPKATVLGSAAALTAVTAVGDSFSLPIKGLTGRMLQMTALSQVRGSQKVKWDDA